MSVDYFASAAFAVRLDDEELKVVDEALEALEEDEDWDERSVTDYERGRAVIAWLEENRPEFLPGLRQKYHGTAATELFSTGSDDDRPGRCQIEADVWLYGVGYLAFGKSQIEPILTPQFREMAEWFSWVSAG